MSCSWEQEDALRSRGVESIAGVDEAGRGPLAGPVAAVALILPRDFDIRGLDDSKKLTRSRRESIFEKLVSDERVIYALAMRSPSEIDRLNILRATHECMKEAVSRLRVRPEHALIDGLPVAGFPVPSTALVKGDGISVSIAAASIMAKVFRDREMEVLDAEFPEYGFSKHKGYGTAHHLTQLQLHGPCIHHRRSFAPVSQASR